MKRHETLISILVLATKPLGLVVIALAGAVIAPLIGVATAADTCGERDIEALSVDQVIVSDIKHGLFQGGTKFTIRCGPWSVEAIYEKSIPKISLLIEAGSGEPPPSVPTALAMRLFRLPLAQLFAVKGRADRYNLAIQNYVALGERIAAAALASPQWDARRGRARSTGVGTFVKELINGQNLHSELVKLSSEFDYRAQVSDVEKVLLCSANKLSLPRSGHSGDLAPCGGLIYFELTRLR